MKNWQRYWLYLLIAFASAHLLRDTFQELGIKNWLSTVAVKVGLLELVYPVYWGIFNTYALAILEIILAAICIGRKEFGKLGKLTIVVAVIAFLSWLFYWIFL